MQQFAEHLRSRLSAPPSDPIVPMRGRVTGVNDSDGSWIVDVEAYANAPADPVLAAILAAGVPEELSAHLSDAVRACALVTGAGAPGRRECAEGQVADVRSQAQDLLGAVETLAGTGCRLDAVMVSAAQQLTGANGRLLLADKGASSPEGLSATQRDRWRGRAKSITRGEIGAAIGWGVGEVSDLVALANAPGAVRVPVQRSLATAESSWKLARSFWRKASTLPHEDGAAIANGLFGQDPDNAVTERLSSAGRLTQQPWSHKKFHQAVDREVARFKTKDPDATKETRARELAESDVWVTVDRDGVGGVGIKCSNTRAAAIGDRIDHAARRARAAGDPRTLRQLRTAVVTALLLHGTVPEPLRSAGGLAASGSDSVSSRDESSPQFLADPVSVPRSPQLDRVLAGLPSATINVVVPLGTLVPGLFAGPEPSGDGPGDNSAHCQTCVCGSAHEGDPASSQGTPPSLDPALSQDPAPSQDPALSQDSALGVAEVIGKWRHFISPTEARGLALAPGSTLHRLLTDPVSGRCLERSTESYRFDAAMRTQIAFADGTCRAPNCTVPAAQCQFDHVQEHGTPGGATRESNGALAHGIDHQRKTEKLWDALISPNRDMTWISMLGRIYRTKAQDYGQYTKLLRAATVDIDHAAPGGDRDAAIDSAVYAALSYRPADDPLESTDDYGEGEDYAAWDLVTLTHTSTAGRRRYEADPTIVTAERQRCAEVRRGTTDSDATGTGTDDTRGTGNGTDDAGAGRDTNTHRTSAWGEEPDGPPPF